MSGGEVPADGAPPAAPGDAAGLPLLIRLRIPVRWRDLDAFNHVNNANYLTYLEEARLQWFATLPGPWIDDRTAPLLAAAHIDYRRPIEWPGEVEVELYAGRAGTSSLTLPHRILSPADGTLYADGHTVLVWIDRATGRGGTLPPAVRSALP